MKGPTSTLTALFLTFMVSFAFGAPIDDLDPTGPQPRFWSVMPYTATESTPCTGASTGFTGPISEPRFPVAFPGCAPFPSDPTLLFGPVFPFVSVVSDVCTVRLYGFIEGPGCHTDSDDNTPILVVGPGESGCYHLYPFSGFDVACP